VVNNVEEERRGEEKGGIKRTCHCCHVRWSRVPVGIGDGTLVGLPVGLFVSPTLVGLGEGVGAFVVVGLGVGLAVGSAVGLSVGSAEGRAEG
jgi:hypothetical protein